MAKGDQDGGKDENSALAERFNLAESSRINTESRDSAPGCLHFWTL